MWNIFNHILAVLCLVDFVVIISNIPLSLRTISPSSIPHSAAIWSDVVCHIAVSSSVFLTIAITLERYLAVSSPLEYQARFAQWSHSKIIFCYLVPVFFFASLFNVPKILNILGVLREDNFGPENQELFLKIAISTQVIHPLCTICIIPIIILCYLNWRILMGAKRMNARGLDPSLYKIMTILVLVFIVLNIPKVALLLYEVSTLPNILECHKNFCLYHIPDIRWLADRIIRYLVLLNSSLNFVIYCFAGPSFQVNYTL